MFTFCTWNFWHSHYKYHVTIWKKISLGITAIGISTGKWKALKSLAIMSTIALIMFLMWSLEARAGVASFLPAEFQINGGANLDGLEPSNFADQYSEELKRFKRSLTTICVEIKPSHGEDEPYFMCKGTGQNNRNGVPSPFNSKLIQSQINNFQGDRFTPNNGQKSQFYASNNNNNQYLFPGFPSNNNQFNSDSIPQQEFPGHNDQTEAERPFQHSIPPHKSSFRPFHESTFSPQDQSKIFQKFFANQGQPPETPHPESPQFSPASAPAATRGGKAESPGSASGSTESPQSSVQKADSRPATASTSASGNTFSNPSSYGQPFWSPATFSNVGPSSVQQQSNGGPSSAYSMASEKNERPPMAQEGFISPEDVRPPHDAPSWSTSAFPHAPIANTLPSAYAGPGYAGPGYVNAPSELPLPLTNGPYESNGEDYNPNVGSFFETALKAITKYAEGATGGDRDTEAVQSQPPKSKRTSTSKANTNRNQPSKSSPNLSSPLRNSGQRFRGIVDDELLGMPNWDFSTNEFDLFNPDGMKGPSQPYSRKALPMGTQPRIIPLEYMHDPVMRTFYESLGKPFMLASPVSLGDPVLPDNPDPSPAPEQDKQMQELPMPFPAVQTVQDKQMQELPVPLPAAPEPNKEFTMPLPAQYSPPVCPVGPAPSPPAPVPSYNPPPPESPASHCSSPIQQVGRYALAQQPLSDYRFQPIFIALPCCGQPNYGPDNQYTANAAATMSNIFNGATLARVGYATPPQYAMLGSPNPYYGSAHPTAVMPMTREVPHYFYHFNSRARTTTLPPQMDTQKSATVISTSTTMMPPSRATTAGVTASTGSRESQESGETKLPMHSEENLSSEEDSTVLSSPSSKASTSKPTTAISGSEATAKSTSREEGITPYQETEKTFRSLIQAARAFSEMSQAEAEAYARQRDRNDEKRQKVRSAGDANEERKSTQPLTSTTPPGPQEVAKTAPTKAPQAAAASVAPATPAPIPPPPTQPQAKAKGMDVKVLVQNK